MTTREMLLYGTNEAVVEDVRLHAGPLSAIFSGGALRDIRLAGVEVIRGLYFLVRDRNWSTMVPDIEGLDITQDAQSFDVTFKCRGTTASDGQTFVWEGRIHGSADRGVVFEASGASDEDFATCRTGFIVLHPLEGVAGCPVEVEHSDGSRESLRFPDRIDPLQSFVDVVALTHEPIAGIRATCRMSGGTWETEDHRNWLDASFKTYFRPLLLPWPYVIPAAEPVRQSVAITFSADISTMTRVPEPDSVTVAVGDRCGLAMPRLGLAVGADDMTATMAALQPLAAIGCQHLTFRVRSDDRDLPGHFRRASRVVEAIGATACLEIVVVDRSLAESEIDLVAIAAASAGFYPASVAVSPEVDLGSYPPSVDRPTGPALRPLLEAARRAFPKAEIGGGMFSFFPELNRRRPPLDAIDFIQHGTASNVHAADDRSIMETLQSLAHVFRSTRAFAGGTPYRISTANIGLPFNPYGASTTPNPQNLRRTMVSADPRQRALFGGAYAAGYLIRAAQGGLDAVTLMSPTGPFGVIGEEGPYPAHAVVSLFAGLAGGALVQTASSDPQRVLALAADVRGRRTLVVANLTPDTRQIAIAGLSPTSIAMLDETTGAAFSTCGGAETTLTLGAYAVARMEG